MSHYDVIIVGGGISGLLLASELAGHVTVRLIEKEPQLPANKYWLTDKEALLQNPELSSSVDCEYEAMRFIAHDGTTATTCGPYVLWNTQALIAALGDAIRNAGGIVSTGCSFYSYCESPSHLRIDTSSGQMSCRLLIDCMGHGSPIASAKGLLRTIGFFTLYGCELEAREPFIPVGLHNVKLQAEPTYLELFPNSRGTVHATVIKPVRKWNRDYDADAEFRFLVNHTSYKNVVHPVPEEISSQRHFGLIPVGVLSRRTLNRILLFGEAGQDHPATSATTLTRLLCNYKQIATFLVERLRKNRLDPSSLCLPAENEMSQFNARFQRKLFESLLRFRSDDFRRLVRELDLYPDDLVNSLIFGRFDCTALQFIDTLCRGVRHRSMLLARHFLSAALTPAPRRFLR